MALAILEPAGDRGADLLFRIDTGTNTYYQLKIGRDVRRRNGIDWVDGVYFTTGLARSEARGGLLDSSAVITVPRARIEAGRAYAQLFSFKSTAGRSPAFSTIVSVPVGGGELLEMSTASSVAPTFHRPRRVPCRTTTEALAQQASLGDLLGQIARIAGPAVLDLLSGAARSGSRPGGRAAGADASPDVAAALLDAVLRSLAGGPTGPLLGHQQSTADSPDNRFSSPFVLGIDDALLAALVGPLVQVLPQLANAANQKRIELRAADNKLITDILSDISRRRLIEQVVAAQPPAGGPGGADVARLIELLQQAPPPVSTASPADAATAGPRLTPAPPTSPAMPQVVPPSPPAGPAVLPAPAPAVTHSLSLRPGDDTTLSARAVVSFVTGAPVTFQGADALVFTKRSPVRLRIRLDVLAPVPTAPLPKAIVSLTCKDPMDESVLLAKSFQLTDVVPNTVLSLDIASDELSRVPTGKKVVVLAELRWPGSKAGTVYKALGSVDVIFADRWFLQVQGAALSTEKELNDLKQYRAFWNKVWESPTLDAASPEKKLLWELDVTAKYSVLLSTEHEANGVMDTKVLKAEQQFDTVSERTEGRMKAGIELSIAELNKLLPLWDGEAQLPPEKLAALLTEGFAHRNACELVRTIKLKGKAAERGMVWVGPVFKLVELTLAGSLSADETGQVTGVTEEKVRFPLPVSARLLGLKSD